MNTPNGSYNTYRLVNDDIRPGSSPQDIICTLRPATGQTGTVSVPYQPGTVVEYCVMRQTTVTVNGQGQYVIAFDNTNDAVAGIMIFGKAQSLQLGGVGLQ